MSILNENRPVKRYGCSQQELYAAAVIGWGSFTEHQPEFEAYSTKYANPFGPDQLAAVDVARNLPDADSRSDEHISLRKDLVDAAVACIHLWRQLESLIRDGFDEDDFQNKRNAAGYGYYDDAVHDDWESVSGLMTSGQQFVAVNAPVLTAGGMPANFPVDFDAARVAFEGVYTQFMDSMQDAKEETDAKITANNEVYEELLKMFADGRKIFSGNAAVRERFIFSRVLELVSSEGNGGGSQTDGATLEGVIRDSASGEGVPGATVQLLQDGSLVEVLTANDSGAYQQAGIEPGSYTLIIDADGYLPMSIDELVLVDGETFTQDAVLSSALVTMSGQVTDENTGDGLAGEIEITHNGNSMTVFTDSEGNFTAETEVEGSTELTFDVTAPGYFSTTEVRMVEPGGTYEFNFNLTQEV